MKFYLKLTKSENDFFIHKISSIGLERYFFELWRNWGLKLINQSKIHREIYLYFLIRKKNKSQLIYKILYLNDFYYELFRTIAIYIEIDINELLSFLIYKDMIGDRQSNENFLLKNLTA